MLFQSVLSQAQNDEQLIRKARQTSNEAIVRQNVEVIASFWLDDYVVIRGSGAVVVGKETNTSD